MLCYVTPKEHLGLPNEKDVKDGIIAYKISATPPTSPADAPAPATATTPSATPATNPIGKNSSRSHSTPRPPRSMHDETLPDDYYKEAAFCSIAAPSFCSMNYSSKVDEYNKLVHGVEKKDYSELVERLVTLK